ncbi:MAG: ATP-dependent 6-phosphofructokinase [Candidatus Omnitrophica bacterium]|nr:ATP-dependent 6-phosphofructokinase [Candidatus Omnitrophota bacterium]
MKANLVPIETLGPCKYDSPYLGREGSTFISDQEGVLYEVHQREITDHCEAGGLTFFELAGPRKRIFYNPKNLTCGIVTCGGLCPGLNNVIRAIVRELNEHYGVTDILGFRYGYSGLTANSKYEPLRLDADNVDEIHDQGGTILGSSRGAQDAKSIIKALLRRRVKILFTVGGDGTMKGAKAIADYKREKKLDISVVAIPKTIDNDINYVSRSFGFETAVQSSMDIIENAHAEAKGFPNGVGLVKFMGRQSGFIAAYATLASGDVNYCLIPEVPFILDGPGGFLESLKNRLKRKLHAVIVVAEGAGQELVRKPGEKAEFDPSGNIKLKDIGVYLKTEIEKYFEKIKMEVNVKYIDPSYIIRSVPANSMDSYYCLILGQCAVHAGMTGRTNMLVGSWNDHLIHVPISMATAEKKRVNPERRLWKTVMESTVQSYSMFRK